ncbi:MAG: hypothetical protein CVU62_13400 [Deltaproteobacteria bacterium HGW-Deltaproteobacteria-2]|jgi:hypothetical protein|nr:MAG: hypothetical protein CVU62_13400 [Deltaproteobacteria bacterium HGW-Deltaproteobacteria-2]
MSNKETVDKIRTILEDARIYANTHILLDGEGHYFTCRGEALSYFEVLRQTEKLRQAVNRSFDYISTLVLKE